jgi:hypothetical protein
MSRQKAMGLRHPQPAGRSKPPRRRGSLAREEDAGGGGAMAAVGEDSIGEPRRERERAEGIKEAANGCGRAGERAQQQLGSPIACAWLYMARLGLGLLSISR